MIYLFNGRINICRQDHYKEYDQQKRNCMPVWPYQQANTRENFNQACYVYNYFLVRNERWQHHGHSFIKCKMGYGRKEEHDAHCKVSGEIKIPIMIKDL